MLQRYTRAEMGRIWSEEARLARWLEIELALTDVLAERGAIPAAAARKLRTGARVDPARMRAIEDEVKHDVVAFVSAVAETVGDEGRFLHLGLTSSDVVDTAFALQLRDAADLLLAGIDRLRQAIRVQAERHRHTLMIGRTHGIHAEPITFGLKCASWWAELGRDRRRLAAAREGIAYGKLSGAVGTFANHDPAVERAVCMRLGLKAEPIATQVVPRDRHAELFTCLAVLAGTCERVAVEIRHLQRTEVMRANLERLGAAIFSEQILLALVRRGVARDQAYRWVQRHALAGGDLQARLAADADVASHLPPAELAVLFDMRHHLRHIDALFARALEDDDGAA